MAKDIDMTDKKRKVVLTVSRVFPRWHHRAGEPTSFAESVQQKRKITELRDDFNKKWQQRRRDINDGFKFLSIREWSGRPYNSEQREIAQVEKIGLQDITYWRGSVYAIVDGHTVPISEIAKNNGLSSVKDLEELIFTNSKARLFTGVVIQLTDFRY